MEIIDFILHLEKNLTFIIDALGPLTYVALFLIIFAETGLVVTPFLPGDSLLFIIGTLAGGNFLNIWVSYLVLLFAAIAGDTVNYWIGKIIGPKVFIQKKSKIFNQAYLEKTNNFYKKHGGKTIILARFIPIIRTFAPFVAGIGNMHYATFISYNIAGAFIWVTSLLFAGYFFGSLPLIRKNFEYFVFGIIIISIAPAIIEYLKAKKESKKSKEELNQANYK